MGAKESVKKETQNAEENTPSLKRLIRHIDDLKKENKSLKAKKKKLDLELQKTRQERDEARNYFQTLFHHSGTVNIITDRDMSIDQVNDLARKLDPGQRQVGAKLWMKNVFPEDLEMMKRYHAQRYVDPESVPAQYEYRLKNKSGKTAVVQITSCLIPGTDKTLSTFLDLTQLRKMSEDIRENELKYRTLFESSGDAIVLIDEATLVDCNTPTPQMFTCSREEILKNFLNFKLCRFWPERQPDGILSLYKYRETATEARLGLSKPSFFQLRRFDGTLFDAEIKMKFIHLGTNEYLMCIIRDISDLKRAEELYRTMADTSSAGVFIIQNNTFKFVNARITEQYGYRLDDLIGMNFSKFIHPDDLITAVKNVTQLLHHRSTTPVEYRVIAKNGKSHSIVANYTYITYEGQKAILGNCLDITELQEMRSKYDELQLLEKTILDTITHAVIGLQNRKIIFANPATEKIFGWNPEELLGKDLSLLYYSEEDYHAYGKRIYPMLDNDAFYKAEIPLRRKDGQKIFCLVHIAPIDNNVYTGRVVSVMEDITDRKQAEMEKRKLEDQLIQSQKMEAMGTLASGIAHDFNNLLTGIQGSTSLLKMEYSDIPTLSNRLETIEDLVQSGAALTRQLLEIGRQGKYRLKTLDINALTDKTASLFARAKKELTITKTLATSIPYVNADQSQIEQMLLNLLVNAWQAMPEGGGIFLETSHVFLSSDFVQPYGIAAGQYVKLSVKDTGTGMDAATKERIFEPFYTTKDIGKGTGLGLTMVYGIIRGHRGMISVDSAVGQGTCFDIYLPASTQAVERQDDRLPQIVKGNETVLIVDDEEVIIEVSREILEMMGYKVLVARNGQEAVDLYSKRKKEIDLVIQDMIMPGISGQEIFKRLKSINPAVKVILSSGYVLNRQIEDVMNSGCRAFLQKPFRTEELSNIIRDVLDSP